ncbi:MAG TPA: hypothetical protein VMM79_00825 [Longimicrobiales bacterium]|nr:hypothetical protein [Longimicrobiales bacterium]
MPRTISTLAICTTILVVVAAGCAHKLTRGMVMPADIATLDGGSRFLKAHMASGNVYVLADWRVDDATSTIVGTGTVHDANRMVVDSGSFHLATDSIVLFETNVVQQSGPSKAITVIFGVTAAVAIACATDPKACFGSCPTIYAPGADGGLSLQAEAFSSSIAPALEATDVDMLLHTRPTGRDYSLRVTNEALETHVIRSLNLLAVPRPPGGRVFHGADGFRATAGLVAPSMCVAAEGDCLDAVIDADGDERFSLADSTDLAVREIVELRFNDSPAGDVGLVVVSRQTLLTTFLIYQALAWLGDEAGRWLASLERDGGSERDRARAVGDVLGEIEVLVQDDTGEWLPAGAVGETGPIAADTRLVRLPRAAGGPITIRLRMTRGLWRIDQVALTSIGAAVEPVRIAPSRVSREDRPEADALESLTDPARTLVTLPGDAYDVEYRLPPDPPSYELFVEATGYYLEWMRQEWLAEQNPLRAAQLLLDPAEAMRALAPAFKQREAAMERLFWNSRYVRPNR